MRHSRTPGWKHNFRELRVELEAAGYWFRSQTDSEVVLTALAHWGVKAFDRFNGMFALAFWDRKERTLLLARNRYGIKPLYAFVFKNVRKIYVFRCLRNHGKLLS